MPSYNRGEVWIVDLKPQAHPEEPSKERPCVIVQDSRICATEEHGTIIVVPISSASEDPSGESEIRIPVGSFTKDPGGKPEQGYALVDCIRSVSKRRFSRGPVHRCPAAAMKKIEKAMRFFLALH